MDTLFNKAIGVFSFSSFGTALAAVDRVGKLQVQSEVLDVAFRGDISDLIVACPQENAISIGQELIPLDPVFTSWILDPAPDLFNLLVLREISDLGESIVIFESDRCGDILNFSNEFFKLKWKAVDFKFLRSSSSAGYVILTSNMELPLELMRTYGQLGKISFIQKPANNLKGIFNIIPE